MRIWKKNKALFDNAPYPNWKRITLPNDLFSGFEKGVRPILESKDQAVEIKTMEAFFYDDWTEEHPYADYFELEHASKHTLGDKFTGYINHLYNSGYVIRSKHKGLEAPLVKVEYDFGAEIRTQIESNLIIAEEGTKLDVVIDYHGKKARHYGMTRVIAKAGSEVRIIKLQRLEEDSDFYDQNFGQTEEGGKIIWIDLQIGGSLKAITYETDLVGRQAMAELKSLYFGAGKGQMDLSYTMRHFGEKTESLILSKGALDHEVKKVFRGNLEFKTGAKQAIGREQEYVVLLNKDVKSDSIPALMCGEDDVTGAHAASVGQVDEDKLFYLMSRGLTESEAKKLIVRGSFETIIGEIPYEAIQTQVAYEMDRRI